MNADDYLRIYVALRTAHPRAAIAAIATLRSAMIHQLGEEEQRALVTRGNAKEVPTEHWIPHAVHRGYCENRFRRAGMTDAELNSTSHVLQQFALELLGGARPKREDLLAKYQARMDLQDWSNARLASNHLLALALSQSNLHLAEQAGGMTLDALHRWPEAREHRPYEFDPSEWIRGNLAMLLGHFELAGEQYRDDMRR